MKNKDSTDSLTRGSVSLDISESCVRSDIADIISKMYTPRGVSRNEVNCGTREAREGEANEGIACRGSEQPAKQFGFYLETVTTRKNLRAVVESSSSDSVSMPSVRNAVKSSGYVCECCRRKMIERIYEKRIKSIGCYCRICKKPNRVRPVRPGPGQEGLLPIKDQRDLPVYEMYRCFKSAPAFTNYYSLKENDQHGQNKINLYKNAFAEKHEHLQALHDFTTDNAKCDQDVPNDNNNCKTTKRSFLNRVIEMLSSFPNMFRGRTTNSTKSLSKNVITLENVDVPKEIASQDDLHQLRNTYSNRHDHKYKDNSVNEDRLMQKYSLSREESLKATIVNLESKLTSFQSKLDLNEHADRYVEMKTSSDENGPGKINRFLQGESTSKVQLQEHATSKNKIKIDSGIQHSRFRPSELLPERAEFYCFDYGNTKYYRTTDKSPPLLVDMTLDRTTERATMFWARVFSSCHLVLAFFTAFALQLLKFLLYSLVRPLLWGTLQIGSDYLFKPCLTILFNGVIQPVFILLQNIATSFRDLCLPLAQCCGYFLQEIAHIFRACRLIEINTDSGNHRNP